MRLNEMKKSTINYRKYEKLKKICPDGIVVDGLDLLQIIDNLHGLLHEFRNKAYFGELNPKGTSVESSKHWQMIRDCFE